MMKVTKNRATKTWTKKHVHRYYARAQRKFKIDVNPYRYQFKYAANEKQEIPFQAIKLSLKLNGYCLFFKNELINK